MKSVKFIVLVLVMMSVMAVSECGEQSANIDKKQAAQTQMVQSRLDAKVGMPSIVNGTEKRMAKELYELRDQADLITYTYMFNEMTGRLTFLGMSEGYGLPASVQYSNPEKEVYKSYDSGVSTIPQAEPNGLFMPEGLSATWVKLLDPSSGKTTAVYIEPLITVSTFPIKNAIYPPEGEQYEELTR